MPRPRVRTQRQGRPGGSPRTGRRQQQQQHRGRQSSDNNTRDYVARKLADKPVGARPEDSDDSDRLVTKGHGGRRGRFNAMQEIYASGGVGAGDKPGSHPTRAQRLKSMAKALNSPRPHLVAARQPSGSGHAPEPATTNTTVTTPARDASILDGFKPRKRQLSVLRATVLDSSTLDLSNDSFALPDDESTPAQVPAPARPVLNGTPIPLSSDSATRKRKLDSEDLDPAAAAIADKENTPLETIETKTTQKKQRSSKWDEIDAFDLQFEDVSVYDRSSEQDAR
ncbi:hypothetical protein DV735_g249, partial [Chaetothyriales sp. CBS 134920]